MGRSTKTPIVPDAGKHARVSMRLRPYSKNLFRKGDNGEEFAIVPEDQLENVRESIGARKVEVLGYVDEDNLVPLGEVEDPAEAERRRKKGEAKWRKRQEKEAKKREKKARKKAKKAASPRQSDATTTTDGSDDSDDSDSESEEDQKTKKRGGSELRRSYLRQSAKRGDLGAPGGAAQAQPTVTFAVQPELDQAEEVHAAPNGLDVQQIRRKRHSVNMQIEIEGGDPAPAKTEDDAAADAQEGDAKGKQEEEAREEDVSPEQAATSAENPPPPTLPLVANPAEVGPPPKQVPPPPQQLSKDDGEPDSGQVARKRVGGAVVANRESKQDVSNSVTKEAPQPQPTQGTGGGDAPDGGDTSTAAATTEKGEEGDKTTEDTGEKKDGTFKAFYDKTKGKAVQQPEAAAAATTAVQQDKQSGGGGEGGGGAASTAEKTPPKPPGRDSAILRRQMPWDKKLGPKQKEQQEREVLQDAGIDATINWEARPPLDNRDMLQSAKGSARTGAGAQSRLPEDSSASRRPAPVKVCFSGEAEDGDDNSREPVADVSCQCAGGMHTEECSIRAVPCPDQKCREAVRFAELISHIKRSHKSSRWLGETSFSDYSTQYWNIRSSKNFSQPTTTWVLTMWRHDGQFFTTMFQKHGGMWYDWVYVFAGPATAAQYGYEIRVRSPAGQEGLEFKGPVHPVDEPAEAVRQSGNCFVLTDEDIRRYMTPDGLSEERRAEGYDFRIPFHYKVTRQDQAVVQRGLQWNVVKLKRVD